jgi:hypothetical protein
VRVTLVQRAGPSRYSRGVVLAPSIEIWRPEGQFRFPLEGERVTIGKRADNPVALTWDGQASRLHAVLERLSGSWCIRDVNSTNGTWVNGERVWTERPLRHGDEILVGRTRIFFHEDEPSAETRTQGAVALPTLTPRERDVLIALCEPVLGGDVFTEPATTRQISEKLVVTEAAVKQHLAHLYDKFQIHDTSERKRVRLANEAIHRGAVSVSDLRKR